MAGQVSIPAPVVALLCERVGRPWPMPTLDLEALDVLLSTVDDGLGLMAYPYEVEEACEVLPTARGHVVLGAHPVTITPDTHVLLAMRLQEARTGVQPVAAWVPPKSNSAPWCIEAIDERGYLAGRVLPGVPDGVTCEACDGVGYVEVAGASGEPDGEGCGACGGTVNGRRGSGRRRVTDPDEALAWACCHWHARQLLPENRGETWEDAAMCAAFAGLTLHTPLRDGVARTRPPVLGVGRRREGAGGDR